jgi:hypothetical protein
MNRLMAILKALGATGRSAGRSVKWADEDVVLRNIEDAIASGEFAARPLGFTFDPVRGKFLEAGQDYGHMMAQVPERVGLNRVPNEQAIRQLVDDPYYMNRLRSGDYLGGWLDKVDANTSEFVVDPSTRFLSRPRSIVRGADATQKAGFSLRDFDEYKLTPELIDAARREMEQRAARTAMGLILGAPAVAGGIGYLASRD